MNTATHTASIMVVDDTPANLRLLDDLLRQQGYRVRLFPRGALALKAAAANPPDLILLDIMMPDMDASRCAASSRPCLCCAMCR